LGSKTESRLSAGPLAVLTIAVLTSFAHCFTLFIVVLCNVQVVGWTFFETHLKTPMINMEKNSIETMDFSDSHISNARSSTIINIVMNLADVEGGFNF